MYTQCPDCAIAFRVTADVLKQAAGKVRCGGCGHAFDALAYLSETRPAEPPRDDTEQGISAEQSAALLKTLDDLAGSDIRLEDTGIEWRLLSDDRTAVAEDDNSGDFADPQTGDHEILDDTSGDVETSEWMDDIESTPNEELRFDDDTGVPDNFDDQAGHTRTLVLEPEPEFIEPEEHTETQVDIVFGEPDEWGELLYEVDAAEEAEKKALSAIDLNPAIIAPEPTDDRDELLGLTFAEELDAVSDDELYDRGDVEKPPDIDTQFNLQAEALGIDLSGLRNTADEDDFSEDEKIPDEVAASDEVAGSIEAEVTGEEPTEIYMPSSDDSSIDNDLYAAAFEAEQAAAAADASARNLALSLNEDEEAEDEQEKEIEEDEEGEDDEIEQDEQDEQIADDSEEEEPLEQIDEETEHFPDSTGALEIELAEAQELSEADDDEVVDSETIAAPESEEEMTINRMIDQDLLRLAIEDDEGVASTMVLQGKGAGNGDEQPDDDVRGEMIPDYDDSPGIETIIMEGEFVRTALEQEALDASAADNERLKDDEDEDDDEETGFIAVAKRTIRGQMAGSDGTPRSSNIGVIAGLVVLVLLLAGQFVHQTRADLATNPGMNNVIAPVYRAVGAPITPEWDVTGWRFEVTRGSTDHGARSAELNESGPDVVISDGESVDTPDGADIGDALPEPEPEVLTIFSRIGNKSSQPLPYPLIGVSLTDRFEETIGSKVLEPNEYLSGNFDIERMVPPGKTFNAVISIESPSVEATGFKLNVCYRQTSGKLRCAVEDFK